METERTDMGKATALINKAADIIKPRPTITELQMPGSTVTHTDMAGKIACAKTYYERLATPQLPPGHARQTGKSRMGSCTGARGTELV